MSAKNFIPTVWSAALLRSLRNSLVYGQMGVVNTRYEGEIRSFGDSVKINSFGDPTVKDYTRNANMDDPEELPNGSQFLLIDQAKYFNFSIDDVDAAQASVELMGEGMRNAGFALRDVADSFLANLMVGAAAGAVGSTASPKTIADAGDAYEYLVDLGVVLDEANVAVEGRWVIAPPWFHGLMLKDSRFVTATPGQDETRRNGRVGKAAGFEILVSNKVPNASSNYKVLAGTGEATSYAEQILQLEAYRPEKRFADALKGLHVYGAKVVRPNGLAVLTVTRP